MKKLLTHNVVVQLAKANERDYITPEDVMEAFDLHDETKVRLDVLEVLGGLFGVEDKQLTAFVAFQGKENE